MDNNNNSEITGSLAGFWRVNGDGQCSANIANFNYLT